VSPMRRQMVPAVLRWRVVPTALRRRLVAAALRRRGVPAVVAAAIAAALSACGSSGQTTHTSSPADPTSSTSAAQSSPATATATSSTLSASAGSTGSDTRSQTKTTANITSTASQNGPELPAEFKIQPGGALTPARVSAPSHTAIALSLVSSGASYVVALGTPHGQSYAVSGDHPVHVILHGLANGSYAIDVNGHPRGQLIVGVAPGP
jgi:plastocyanin